MTLAEIAQFCAETLGMTDNLTVAQAKKFAQSRWKLIWNTADWKQARMRETVSVPAGNDVVELSPDVQLVVAVRIAGNRELLPTSEVTQIAIDPAGFGTSGQTYGFSPMPVTSAGHARIRLHRAPEKTETLLVLAKAKCAELTADNSTTLIPGADECLIAFTLGDLYRWQRQFSKADVLYAEARGHLKVMQDLETVQAATMCRIVPFVENGSHTAETDWLTQK